MWEIDILLQIETLAFCILTGFIGSIIYALFHAFSYKKKNSIAVIFSDVLFWAFISLLFYIFSLVFTNGEIRFYYVIVFTLSLIYFYVSFPFIIRFLSLVFEKIKSFFVLLFCYLQKGTEIFYKTVKKVVKNVKKILQKCVKVLYNNRVLLQSRKK